MSGLLVIAALLALQRPAQPALPLSTVARPLVGAIRWDGWYGASRGVVGRVVQECLSPKQYQHRAPFFARVIGPDAVEIGPYTQAIVDREIAAARRAGLDYWAYVAYEESDPLSDALKLHLSSKHRADMQFCMIVEAGRTGDTATFSERMERFVGLMRSDNYVHVMGMRPLLFVGFIEEKHLEAWGGPHQARRLFDDFRARARSAGAGDPCVVIMDFDPVRAKRLADILGADAVSAYAIPGDGGNESPYARLREVARRFWETARDIGAHVVPTAMAGWDRRPRIERPHPWEPWQKPGEGMNRYYQSPTPQDLAEHVREAVDWVLANPRACPLRTVLIYAWNEHDEGGWLCPTLGEGIGRVRALEHMWRQWSRDRRTRVAAPADRR